MFLQHRGSHSEKSFQANFDAAGKFLTDFPAARNAIPAKVWALSGKENGCWKIGRAFGNAAGFSPPRPPQPSWVLLRKDGLVSREHEVKTRLSMPLPEALYENSIMTTTPDAEYFRKSGHVLHPLSSVRDSKKDIVKELPVIFVFGSQKKYCWKEYCPKTAKNWISHWNQSQWTTKTAKLCTRVSVFKTRVFAHLRNSS